MELKLIFVSMNEEQCRVGWVNFLQLSMELKYSFAAMNEEQCRVGWVEFLLLHCKHGIEIEPCRNE
jgi:hypothetical protein